MTELRFNQDTEQRNFYQVSESFSHPAKMHISLLKWIVDNFTSEGETILDLLCGIGTTLIAATLGRNVIAIDLEQKFIDICHKNWEKIKTIGPEMGYSFGWAIIKQGDARQLEGILIDAIVTSPPYADQLQRWGNTETKTMKQKSLHQENKQGIGALPYGQIDCILSSPPYAESKSFHDLQFMDETSGDQSKRTQEGKIKGHSFTPEARQRVFERAKQGEIDNPENIGNLKSQTYLEAMLQVYQQMYRVLKPAGKAIIVTKNFIRNKQVVRLDLDTIKLMEKAGFELLERHYRKLIQESFWRTIYYQKHPEVEPIEHEDILVFEK